MVLGDEPYLVGNLWSRQAHLPSANGEGRVHRTADATSGDSKAVPLAF
jgi:hypothetical protein